MTRRSMFALAAPLCAIGQQRRAAKSADTKDYLRVMFLPAWGDLGPTGNVVVLVGSDWIEGDSIIDVAISADGRAIEAQAYMPAIEGEYRAAVLVPMPNWPSTLTVNGIFKISNPVAGTVYRMSGGLNSTRIY